jgi:hypothetical protein
MVKVVHFAALVHVDVVHVSLVEHLHYIVEDVSKGAVHDLGQTSVWCE